MILFFDREIVISDCHEILHQLTAVKVGEGDDDGSL